MNITLIGCGKMGTAMALGWLKADLVRRLQILDPAPIDAELAAYPQAFHVEIMESLDWGDVDMVVLALKPQGLDDLCEALKPVLPVDIAVLSIVAGKNTAFFQAHLTRDVRVIRTMPNLPAAIGKGITALYAAETVSMTQRDAATQLMQANGDTIWLDDEAQMDAITALSGSGPAYLFYFIEALAKAGEAIGLNADQAIHLARRTVIGSAALVEAQADTTASTLRQNVTSKAGTTAAGLDVLMNGELDEILTRTLAAAQARSKELNK